MSLTNYTGCWFVNAFCALRTGWLAARRARDRDHGAAVLDSHVHSARGRQPRRSARVARARQPNRQPPARLLRRRGHQLRPVPQLRTRVPRAIARVFDCQSRSPSVRMATAQRRSRAINAQWTRSATSPVVVDAVKACLIAVVGIIAVVVVQQRGRFVAQCACIVTVALKRRALPRLTCKVVENVWLSDWHRYKANIANLFVRSTRTRQ